MKKLSIILVLIMILGAFSSCVGIGNKPPADTTEPGDVAYERDFSFSYELDRTEYTRGETIKIKATVTNSSGEDYIYTGSSTEFFPSISLYWIQIGDEKGGVIDHDPVAVTDDFVKMTIKNGESGSRTYSFKIPDDAVCADYSITLSFGRDSKEFLGVLRIAESTSQNSSDEYDYSPITVSSGSGKINPVRCFLSSTVYDGDSIAEGCGAGIGMIFGNDKTDQSTFPVLVLDGKLEALLPVNSSLVGVTVYDLDYNAIEEKKSISELSELPEGEYLIVLRVKSDSRGCIPDVSEYSITDYEDFFKFIIPKDAIPAFSYAKESEMYKENDPGVKSSGFGNTTEVEINTASDAVSRAKNECTVQYNAADVSFDYSEEIWKVVFYTKGVLGGCQTVYFDKNGITLLIVYGE
ncbi:MAG: hypothetical protein IJD70_04215 [Clostridia bacterium]|nr:hypothetical protein [Clostridia bacterium]